MRLFVIAGLVISLSSSVLWAQSSVYNSKDSSQGTIYNSSGSTYGQGGPLSLRQMLDGRGNAADGSDVQYYGGSNFRPYGLDNPNFNFNVTPEEAKEARRQRDLAAQQQEKDNIAAMQAYYDEYDAYNQQILEQNASPGTVRSQSRNIKVRTNRDLTPEQQERLDKPKRIFNSVR